MRFIVDVIEMIISVIYISLEQVFQSFFDWFTKDPKKHSYKASTAFIPPSKLLKKKHRGFCLNGSESLSAKHSFQNTLIVGGTGVGKSSIVLIPSLLKMKGSFVIHDPSGELYQKSAGYLQRKGYSIYRLNFSNPNQSDRFNPLSRALNSSGVNKVASMLIRTNLGEGKADPFWSLLGVSLLSITIGMVKRNTLGRQNVAEVRHLLGILSSSPRRFLARLEEIGNPTLLREFKTFQAYDRKVKAGVVATIMSALQIFSDADTAKVTARDSIYFQDLRKKKIAIYIQNPVFEQTYYATLTSIFFEQLFGYLLKNLPSKDDLPVYCLIDEAGVLSIPSLDTAISNIRKYKAGILLAIQAVEQLEERYGQKITRTILANSFAKVYFTGQTGTMAEELEKSLGEIEYTDTRGKEKKKPLLTRAELRTLPHNTALLIAGSLPPIKMKLYPYYKNKRLLKKTHIPTLPANHNIPYVKTYQTRHRSMGVSRK